MQYAVPTASNHAAELKLRAKRALFLSLAAKSTTPAAATKWARDEKRGGK